MFEAMSSGKSGAETTKWAKERAIFAAQQKFESVFGKLLSEYNLTPGEQKGVMEVLGFDPNKEDTWGVIEQWNVNKQGRAVQDTAKALASSRDEQATDLAA